MTIENKLASFIATILLAGSVAAHAQNAAAPDPNIAPSTVEQELALPEDSGSGAQLAMAPDPDVAPSIAEQEANLPDSSPDRPQLALDPDADIARSDDMMIAQ
jgi:hypothetical protein